MHFFNLLPLALGVSSFLLVPKVNDDILAKAGLPPSQESDKFSLKCIGGCPAAQDGLIENGKAKSWSRNEANTIDVDITVYTEKVYFNGQQIWPPVAPTSSLTIRQQGNRAVPISSSISWQQDLRIVDKRHPLKIHTATIEIMSIGDQVVQAESVELRIVEPEYGWGVGLLPSSVRPYKSSPLIDSCTNVWCRVRGALIIKYTELHQAMANKLRGWRKCNGKAGHKTGGMRLKGGANKFGPGATLHPHGHHGHHHRRGGFFRAIFSAIKVAAVPTVLGLSIGYLIGSILKFFILRAQRRRAAAHGEYTEVKQSDIEEGRGSVDEPPKYEEVYGGEEAEKEDEKK